MYEETILEHEITQNYYGITTAERKWKTRLAKLADQYPGECVCKANNPDGIVFYHVPENWVTVRPPRKLDLSDEQRQVLSDRMKKLRESQ